jgi:hypothetical protein
VPPAIVANPAPAGTTSAGANPSSANANNLSPAGSLEASLTTNQSSYVLHQVVAMTFTETNDTGHVVSVDMGPSFDGFFVTRGGKTIWRSNPNAPDFVVLRRVLPGQSITLTADWTAPAMAGTYVAHNQLAPNVTASFTVDAASATAAGTVATSV